jgi:hypothetical protein
MLISPSTSWRGTDGRGMTVAEFGHYVRDLKLEFTPSFVALHNTASPNAKQWQSCPVQTRLRNLTSYYSGMGWHGGPHLFVDNELIWLFTPLTKPGVHSPSWNSTAWGIEMVGDYDCDSFETGFGLAVRHNAVAAAAILLKKMDKPVNGHTLRFHYEDPRTTHACPGKHVKKSEILAEISARMAGPLIAGTTPTKKKKPTRYTVLMTEFGGRGDAQQSAYGGHVNPYAFEVALPCKVPAAQRSIAIYRGSKKVIARVNDLGPWNKTNDYWNHDGIPKCVMQKAGRNRAENHQVPTNSAGLDATPAVFDELGIRGEESTRQATVEWEFVHPPIDHEDNEGEHPIPPPEPPRELQPWWARVLGDITGRHG